ncbi:MAG: RNA polymerase sigma factor [Gemmataceae bacterium]
MATNLSKVVKHLHHLLAPPGGERTDGELLARFVAMRDEASFAALMRRHGPMVLAVCRRLLRHAQDAEDCFQATFMVLAQGGDGEKRFAGQLVVRRRLSDFAGGKVGHRPPADARKSCDRASRSRQL